MLRLIKRLMLLAGMIVAFESSASALPCTDGTLATYIGLGSTGCTVGDALFSDFTTLGVPTGAVPILPGSIIVNPLTAPSNPGFKFQVSLSAGAGELLEALIGYIGSASSFTGNTLSMDGSSATGDGAVTVVEDKCLGGIFGPGGPGECPGVKKTLIVFDIGIDADTTEELSFPPVNRIGVITDIAVDGGLDGTGALQSATNQFQITSAAVPEPSTMAMVVLGVLSMGLFYPRRRQV